MARLVWGLFCERHSTDAGGKSSYLGVFDAQTLTIRSAGGAPVSQEPLPKPVPSSPFVLALNITAEPGAPVCRVLVKDSEDREVVPAMASRLSESPDGRYNLHVGFPHGIPVARTGLYTFQVFIEDQLIGEVELPIRLEIIQEPEG